MSNTKAVCNYGRNIDSSDSGINLLPDDISSQPATVYKAHISTDKNQFHHVILAAANKFFLKKDGVIIREITLVDNCHNGRNMISIISAFHDAGFDVEPCFELEDFGEGFIDEDGTYHNRSEAFRIVKSSGQLFNEKYTLAGNKLDSSCIRHFPADVKLDNFVQ